MLSMSNLEKISLDLAQACIRLRNDLLAILHWLTSREISTAFSLTK